MGKRFQLGTISIQNSCRLSNTRLRTMRLCTPRVWERPRTIERTQLEPFCQGSRISSTLNNSLLTIPPWTSEQLVTFRLFSRYKTWQLNARIQNHATDASNVSDGMSSVMRAVLLVQIATSGVQNVGIAPQSRHLKADPNSAEVNPTQPLRQMP